MTSMLCGLVCVVLLSGLTALAGGQQADCPDLPSLTNGMIMYSAGSPDNRPLGSSAVYSCNTNYTLTGDTLTAAGGTMITRPRVCVSGGRWSGSAPTCQMNTVPTTCPDLIVPANGMISYNMGTASLRPVDTVATFTCDTGYTLTGGTTRVCASGGVWSGSPPTCQLACFDLPPLMNGVITYTDGLADSRPINTIATFTCGNGYTLTGGIRACQNDRTWSGTAPTCQLNTGPTEPPTTCPDLTVPANGMISYNMETASPRPVDTVAATYTCNTGYTLTGDSISTCGSGGVWSSTDAPVCQTNCLDLLPLINGMIIYSDGSTNNRPFSSSAVHSCNTGYTLTGGTFTVGTTRFCVSGGRWDGSAQTCQGPTDPPTTICPNLTRLPNGMITYSAGGSTNNRRVGSTAAHSCDSGYRLDGEVMRTCRSGGTWSGSAPVCEQRTCSDLPPLMNGVIAYTDGLTDSRPINTSIATFTCDNGYTLTGGSVRACQIDGTWSGTAQTCQPTCPDLTVPANGMIIYSSSTSPHPQGTVATQSCLNGYVPSTTSTATRVCGADRSWSGSNLTCQLPPVYVSMGTTNYAVMNSQVAIDTIGDTIETALTCRTDSTICCTGQDNSGDWLLPNGTVVTRNQDITDSDTDLLYSVGDTGALRLHRRGSVSGLTGSYCCVIPDNTGVDVTFCVQLVTGVITISPPTTTSTDESCFCQCPQSDNTGAVVGGVVALVAVIAVTVVMVTYLVLRYKRGGKMTVPRDISLTDQGQSAAATYETVLATYEEIPASREVKGDYSYTQNNAYSTVSGREAPAAGGIQ